MLSQQSPDFELFNEIKKIIRCLLSSTLKRGEKEALLMLNELIKDLYLLREFSCCFVIFQKKCNILQIKFYLIPKFNLSDYDHYFCKLNFIFHVLISRKMLFGTNA